MKLVSKPMKGTSDRMLVNILPDGWWKIVCTYWPEYSNGKRFLVADCASNRFRSLAEMKSYFIERGTYEQ